MANDASKIIPATHLILDQPVLKVPYELLRKNFKTAQTVVEKDSTALQKSLKETASSSLKNASSPDDVLKSLDSMIARMQTLKRKLESCSEEDHRLREQSYFRIKHLSAVYEIPSTEDVVYEDWSRTRLDRVLGDWMLRRGYNRSAEAMIRQRTEEGKEMGSLVDEKAYREIRGIAGRVEEKSLREAERWCAENKKELRKMDSPLEFMLRVQQYVELVRAENISEAIFYARKHIMPSKEKYPEIVKHVPALLAYKPEMYSGSGPHMELYSSQRYKDLSALFTDTAYKLLGIPPKPPLLRALSAGLSALKTPMCYSGQPHKSQPGSDRILPTPVSFPPVLPGSPPSELALPAPPPLPNVQHRIDNFSFEKTDDAPPRTGDNGCPICSMELNELARDVPHALQEHSRVDHDVVMLPNRRVYGKTRLLEYAKRMGMERSGIEGQDEEEWVVDPVTGELFHARLLQTVYIS